MNLDQKNLEILLQKLKGRSLYKNKLEQYDTDPSIVATISFMARMNGDIEGKNIVDPGTGNGVFAYAAAILGAQKVTAVDIDDSAIEVAKENCRDLPVNFVIADISDFEGNFDTCLMNPPWGSVKKGSDIPFLDFSVRSCKRIYSIHNLDGIEYVERFFSGHGSVIQKLRTRITIRRIYPHHKMERAYVNAVILVTDVSRNH